MSTDLQSAPSLARTRSKSLQNECLGYIPPGNFGHDKRLFHITFYDTNETYRRNCDALIRELVATQVRTNSQRFRICVGKSLHQYPGGRDIGLHQHPDWVDETKQHDYLRLDTAGGHEPSQRRVLSLFREAKVSSRIIVHTSATFYFQDIYHALRNKFCEPRDVRAGHARYV